MKRTLFLFFLCLAVSAQAQMRSFGQRPTLPKGKTGFSISVGGFIGQRLAPVQGDYDKTIQQYFNDLKKGNGFDIGVGYFYDGRRGFGLKFSQFHSANSLPAVTVTYPDGTFESGPMSDDITITFVGPQYLMRLINDPRTPVQLTLGIALGYVGYVDNGVLIRPIKIQGATVATSIDLGLDVLISEGFWLGLNGSYSGGLIKSFVVTQNGVSQTIDDDKGIGLSRATIGVCAKYCF